MTMCIELISCFFPLIRLASEKTTQYKSLHKKYNEHRASRCGNDNPTTRTTDKMSGCTHTLITKVTLTLSIPHTTTPQGY